MKPAKLGTPEPFAALNRIPIRENFEPLVDIREHCPKVIAHRGILPYIRRGVADMLNKAQSLLPPGHHFRVHTALRTLEMQSEMYWRHYKDLQEKHPDWPKSALRRANNKYFAAPDVKAPPGHCTGSAVDLAIVSPDGHNLDMTSPSKGWDAAYTFATNLSDDALYNRKMLIDAMFAAGFSNCRDEWWHWSYGDNAWAVRTGNSIACYGLIRPPTPHTRVGPSRPRRRIVRRKTRNSPRNSH
jgi:D-alanyl-D-alanine dipeptidase